MNDRKKKGFLNIHMFICKVTLNDPAIPTSDDGMSFQIDNGNQMEEGSSGVGNLGNHDTE